MPRLFLKILPRPNTPATQLTGVSVQLCPVSSHALDQRDVSTAGSKQVVGSSLLTVLLSSIRAQAREQKYKSRGIPCPSGSLSWKPVVSIQSCFDTSRFDTNSSGEIAQKF